MNAQASAPGAGTMSDPARGVSTSTLGFFDRIEGSHALGWACDLADPAAPLTVEAVCEGRVVAAGPADLYRGDVAAAGLPTARCGFRLRLGPPLSALLGRDIHVRVAGTGQVLAGSPRRVAINPLLARFLTRADAIPPAALARLRRRVTWQTRDTPVSVVMPVRDPAAPWLAQALASVRGQWSANWELVCVDDASTAPHVAALLGAAAGADARVRVLRAPAPVGIAAAVNFGLRAARGEYVLVLDHDDALEPDAVHALALAARQTGADLVYADEAVTGESTSDILEVRARPAFSYDYLLSHPYIVHPVLVRRDLAHRVAGWDESMPISADVDFLLRALERARRVAHVPRVLYRWRTHAGSAGHTARAGVMAATRGALARHLARRGIPATVQDGPGFNQFRVDWPDDGGDVLAVVPTRDRADLLRACAESVERTCRGERLRFVFVDHASTEPAARRLLARLARRHTVMPYEGPFNFARMNNRAVRAHGAGAKHLLFLNNDVEAVEAGWLPRLRSLSARPDVGAVGCQLLYGDGRIQHGGVLVGFRGAADHAGKLEPSVDEAGARNPGYGAMLTAVRDYSAVTAACMMLRREVFEAVGGFDEGFAVGFNDTDLCLRIRRAGWRVLYDGHTVLRHHESATRIERGQVEHPEDDARLRARWPAYFTRGDPFYNPLLSPAGQDHTPRDDTGCKGRLHPRVVDVALGPLTSGPLTSGSAPPGPVTPAPTALSPGVDTHVAAPATPRRRRGAGPASGARG